MPLRIWLPRAVAPVAVLILAGCGSSSTPGVAQAPTPTCDAFEADRDAADKALGQLVASIDPTFETRFERALRQALARQARDGKPTDLTDTDLGRILSERVLMSRAVASAMKGVSFSTPAYRKYGAVLTRGLEEAASETALLLARGTATPKQWGRFAAELNEIKAGMETSTRALQACPYKTQRT